MKKLALLLAALLALSLTGCQSRPPMTSSSSAVAAPATESAAPAPSAPESAAPSAVPVPLLLCDEGVQVKELMRWEPGQQSVEIPFPAWEGWLVTEVRKGEDVRLVGFDLDTGEEGYLGLFPREMPEGGYNLHDFRRVLDAPNWQIKIFAGDSYRQDGWTHSIGSYTLPEALWEGRRRYGSGWDWDAQPERDLLTWTDPDGLWLAGADGSDPRLLLRTEEMGPYLVQWEMMKDYRPYLADDLPVGERLAFLSPRLMNGGRTIAVDFGQWGNQMGHNGLAVVDIAAGKTNWYNHYVVMTAGDHEFLDDTHILMGNTLIDVVTGETEPAWQYTIDPLFSGDFTHYFGSEEQADGRIDLFTCTLEERQEAKPFLTATGYRHLSPFFRSAIDARRVVCRYETADEAGLMLVTLPE